MQRRVPSIEKIKRLIGYVPTKTLDDVLISIIDYIKKQFPLEKRA